MKKEEILARLPYSYPFLFVDELLSIDENGSTGTFTYSPELDFYKGHFKDHPGDGFVQHHAPALVLRLRFLTHGYHSSVVYFRRNCTGVIPQ